MCVNGIGTTSVHDSFGSEAHSLVGFSFKFYFVCTKITSKIWLVNFFSHSIRPPLIFEKIRSENPFSCAEYFRRAFWKSRNVKRFPFQRIAADFYGAADVQQVACRWMWNCHLLWFVQWCYKSDAKHCRIKSLDAICLRNEHSVVHRIPSCLHVVFALTTVNSIVKEAFWFTHTLTYTQKTHISPRNHTFNAQRVRTTVEQHSLHYT